MVSVFPPFGDTTVEVSAYRRRHEKPTPLTGAKRKRRSREADRARLPKSIDTGSRPRQSRAGPVQAGTLLMPLVGRAAERVRLSIKTALGLRRRMET